MRHITMGLAIVLAGCQWVPGTSAQKIEEAKRLVRGELVDGASAQFEDVVISKGPTPPEKVCGWVNAKNRLGGYVGAQQFLVADGAVRQLGTVRDEEYVGAFGACVAGHERPTQRMKRDGESALQAYEAAVDQP